jgi:flagellar protein FlaJ
MNLLNRIAFKIFGGYLRKNREKYTQIITTLKQIHIDKPWDIYISTAYLLTIIVFAAALLFTYLLKPLWSQLYSIAKTHAVITLPVHGENLFIAAITITLSLLTAALTYYGIINYPGLAANIRKSKIDATLPHAVSYMHALSKGGQSLITILKSLSQHTDIYGEAAEEISHIVLHSEMSNDNLLESLKKAALITPSEKFRDFLENLINTAETGGSLESFFSNMVEHYHEEAAAEQNLYLETLGMLAETYVTVFVAGPLFLITILIVLGLTGTGTMLLLKIVVYAVIPLSAIGFSIILSAISLESDTKLVKTYSISKKMHHYKDAPIKPIVSREEQRRVRRVLRALRWTSVIEARKNPLKRFFANPEETFYLATPAALTYIFFNLKPLTIEHLDDVIIISTLLLLTPFLFFYEMQSRRIRKIEDTIPEFLKRLAVINDVGMPIVASIKVLNNINLGVLSTEVRLIDRDLSWSNDLRGALTKFERRVRTVALARIVRLITRASETTGNIKETLRVAADYAELTEKMRREKFNTLFSYLIVIYMSFVVFLVVLYIFVTMFLPKIPDTTIATGDMFSISAPKDYVNLFLHASVIQGFFSGIIAGQMMGVSLYDGLKHSVIMVTAAYLLFHFI